VNDSDISFPYLTLEELHFLQERKLIPDDWPVGVIIVGAADDNWSDVLKNMQCYSPNDKQTVSRCEIGQVTSVKFILSKQQPEGQPETEAA